MFLTPSTLPGVYAGWLTEKMTELTLIHALLQVVVFCLVSATYWNKLLGCYCMDTFPLFSGSSPVTKHVVWVWKHLSRKNLGSILWSSLKGLAIELWLPSTPFAPFPPTSPAFPAWALQSQSLNGLWLHLIIKLCTASSLWGVSHT